MQRALICALSLFVLSPLGVSAQQSNEEVAAKIDRYIDEAVSLDAFSGTVLLTKDGRSIYERAAGEASKSYQIGNNINTRFNIGSVGKVFTATAIMQLAQSGKLKLDDTIDKYLPEFPYAEKDEITIQQLLNHSAGMGDYFEHPDFYAKKEALREISDFLSLVYEMKLVARPGEEFNYSNSGYVLLGAIIEKVSGQLYRTYIDENIFEPLEMKVTEIIYIEDIVPNIATGYYPKNADELQQNILVHGRACPAGGIFSTVHDLSKFDQGLKTEKILRSEFIEKMFEPSEANPEYGSGWEILDINGHKVLGHSGGHYGIEAIFYRYVEEGYTIIVLSNYSGGAGHVASAMADIIFTGESKPVDQARMNAAKCLNLFELGKHEEAFKVIDRNINRENPHIQSHYLAARLRIVAGTELEKALELLDKYLELAPDDMIPSKASAWWRKGLALEQMKDQDKARECYLKSLELDPTSDDAEKSLESLTDGK